MVFPSLYVSFGLPIVEAMSVGCPVAAADLPYAHELAGSVAKYFNPHSPRCIAACILDILQDDEKRRALKEAALGRAPQFAYDSIAERIAVVLEHVAAKRS
jgi:glycosyltransferase involved in cell wall biosynthesis